MIPKTLEELVEMIARRDDISINEAYAAVYDTFHMLEDAFISGNVEEAEDILREELGLEPDYLDLFVL